MKQTETEFCSNPYMNGYDVGYEQALKDLETYVSDAWVQLVIADLRKRVAS